MAKTKKVKITEAMFKRYLRVQHSGKYNMIMEAHHAMLMASLTREEYMDIIKNYEAYYRKWGGDAS